MHFYFATILRDFSSIIQRWLLVMLVVANVSCASKARRMVPMAMEDGLTTYSGSFSISSAPGPPLKLRSKDLAPYLEVERTHGPLTVKGSKDYLSLVDSLARFGGETLEQTKRELGIETNLKIHIVLVPVDHDAWPSLFEFETKMLNNNLTNPLLIDREKNSLMDLLRFNGPVGYDFLTSGAVGHE